MRGEIIGYIPQVEHTYAYIEGLYGITNEFQVSIGESTCAAKLYAAPIGPSGNGFALLEASKSLTHSLTHLLTHSLTHYFYR